MASNSIVNNIFARSTGGTTEMKEKTAGVTTFLTAMRRFQLLRREDETGISGTGVVAEGVEFSDGRAVLCWLASALDPRRGGAIAQYASIEELRATHGHGGRTVIVWTDDAPVSVQPV